MKKSYFKYIASLFLFGSNGIVASYILLSSTEIVLTRTLIGSLFLILIFSFSERKTQFYNKRHFFVFSAVFLGETLSFAQIFGAMLILGGAAFGELFR